MDTLVDSNVIIDILTDPSPWNEWSSQQLSVRALIGNLVINPIIYAEVSWRFDDQAILDKAISTSFFRRDALPWDAAFLAARAFQAYRKRGGQKTAALPDFFIGAHAAVAGFPVLTRDTERYATYFPQVKLIAP